MLTLLYHVTTMKWAAGAAVMLGTAPTYYAVWGGWRILTAVLPARVFERGDELLYELYQKFLLFFFENCSGVKLIFYGDIETLSSKKENVIFLSNHQCTDWMVADFLASRQGSLGRIRYILKDGLKYMPLYGYYFRQHSCIYVKRGGSFDQKMAEQHLDAFTRNKTPFWMVVFPEGTRYNPELTESIAQSRNYAKTNGWPLFNHVLAPRVKALQLCVNRLRPSCAAVYDVTAAYSSTLVAPTRGLRGVAPSLSDFLQGQCRQVHVHIKRIPIEDVPLSDNDFEKWLIERFCEKDKLLSKFYSVDGSSERGKLGDDPHIHPLSLAVTLPAVLFFTALNGPMWATETGRSACWKLAVIGTVVSWAWVSVRS